MLKVQLKFVRDHHRKVARVAFATDSPVGPIAEKMAPHFVNAEVKQYAFSEYEIAKSWVIDGAIQ